MYETLKQANMEHIKTLGGGLHLLRDKETGQLEIWVTNRCHAGHGLIYKNTHLEFCRTQQAQSYCGVNDCAKCSA